MTVHFDPRTMPIVGSGGMGKGGGGHGVEAPNSLRSKAKARLIELLGEGPIVGLVNGRRSIYFDQTVVENANGSLNFKGVTYQQRRGLPDQEHLHAAPMAETPYSVEVRVKEKEAPPVRTIMEQNADAVRVVIRIPALAHQDKKTGDIKPTSVSYAIDRRNSNGTWQEVIRQDITNQKCTSPYEKAHRVPLPAGGYPWDIRVRRITPDSEVIELQNETWWASYTVIVEGKFTYPNSALVYLEVDAEQFGQNSIPSRYFHVKGLRIKVPSNYDPEKRSYTGIWDGTFKVAWTDNPAWVLYDLLTNNRYGLGEFIDATKVDKWSLYQIAQYCDQKVPNGYGGEEPRYTFNGVINSRDEAFKVLQMITTAFRGMAYWSLGQVFAVADMPGDPKKLVSPADVIEGRFNYNGTAMKARHSVALVSWNDPKDFYRPAVEVVVNEEMLQKFGWRETEVQLIGCTSRGLAHRYGKWILDSEQNETETVEYEASWDHADIRPGDLIAIADPRKAQVRSGGRLAAVAGTVITLDAPFDPRPGQTYNLMVELPDGTVESRAITAFENGNRTVRVFPGYSQAPKPNAMWVITGSDVAPRLYRVLAIEETDKHLFKITALFHDPTKYARVEEGIHLDPPTYSRPRNQIEPPTHLTAVESLFFRNGVARSRISLSWTPSHDFMAAGYLVSMDAPNEGFVNLGRVSGTSIDIDDTTAGEYIFYVSAVALSGATSQPATLKFTAKGWEGTDAPFVSHLEIYGRGSSTEFSGRNVRLVWRNNFPGVSQETGTGSAGQGAVNPFFRDNVIRVFDVETGQLVRVETVFVPDYTYTYENNVSDFAAIGKGPQRKFRFEVTVRDNLGRESKPAKIVPENPVPDLIIPRLWTNNSGALYIDYDFPDDLDFAGAMVWAQEKSGYDPYGTVPVYDGPNNFVSVPLKEFTTYYVRFGAYDAFDKTGLNISPEITITTSGIVVDSTPPAIPTGLKLETRLDRQPDGGLSARIIATWDKSPSENFGRFEVEIMRAGGDWIGFATGGPKSADAKTVSYEWTGLVLNETYSVRVKSVSRNSVSSGYTDVVSITTPVNTRAPNRPSGLTAQASLKSVFLKWNNPADPDLDVIEIWSHVADIRPNPSNPDDAHKLIGTSKGIAFTHSGVATGEARFYWVRARNTSGLYSDFNAVAGTVVVPGQVQEGDIAANAVIAEHIRARSITGDHIDIHTALPPTITVGTTGVSIGTIHERADDPAAVINQRTTKIDPGQILIAGDTTLASWRDGTDATKIRGGAISTNSITANQLAVGLRGITVSGIQFSYNRDTNLVTWTSGTIEYIGDDGKMKRDAISGSSKAWSAGTTLYFVWTRGSTALSTPTTAPTGPDSIILATYRGGIDLNVTYGRTMIDGSQIRTRSLTADLVAAGEFITDKAQIRGGIIENTHLAGQITFDKLAGGTLSAADKVRIGGDRFILNAPDQTLRIYDAQAIGVLPGELSAGRLRVKIGRLGSGSTDYGLQLFDANGNLIFGSGGFGSSVIPDSAIQALSASKISGNIDGNKVVNLGQLARQNTVDRSQATGFGAMSAIDYISAHNIGTYIAGAAISNAYIADLHGDKIHANSLHATKIQAYTITARELSATTLITDSAQIGDAVIKRAKIGFAEIDTLRLANGSVTAGNTASAQWAAGNPNPLINFNVYCRQSARLVILASYSGSTSTSFDRTDASFEIRHNSAAVGTFYGRAYVARTEYNAREGVVTNFYSQQGTMTMVERTATYEGNHNFQLRPSGMMQGGQIVLTVLEFAR